MVNFSAPAGSDGPPGTLTMVDVRGRTVLTRPVASETTRLDISGLQPGIYFVRFGNPRATRVLKLVKD